MTLSPTPLLDLIHEVSPTPLLDLIHEVDGSYVSCGLLPGAAESAQAG
jgi:hypothetical protein